MGLEARCAARYRGERSDGKALLETDEIVFRGAFRFAAPFGQLWEVHVDGGDLHLALPDGVAVLELGTDAAKWADRILNPKSRLDKLGIKPGQRVCLVDFADPELLAELAARGAEVVECGSVGSVDHVFLGVRARDDLARLPELIAWLRPKGGIWTIRRKGSSDVSEADVLGAGRAAGLTDTKVVRFSEALTAERFVPRRAP
jgi:hypothetical protein